MKLEQLREMEYAVSGLRGFTLSEALRLWKAKFETVKHFQKEVITHTCLVELGAFVEEQWEHIIPFSVSEAFQEMNMEHRRVMFDCIGVAKMFQVLEPVLLDKQVLVKTRRRWDAHNRPYEHQFEDVYELYRIDSEKLFTPIPGVRSGEPVYAVRCWCTTTAREYWIYVPPEAATGRSRWSRQPESPDAVRAIAWTIRLDISHPARIYRQGDIIIAEESALSSPVAPYHLSKEQYLELVFSET